MLKNPVIALSKDNSLQFQQRIQNRHAVKQSYERDFALGTGDSGAMMRIEHFGLLFFPDPKQSSIFHISNAKRLALVKDNWNDK